MPTHQASRDATALQAGAAGSDADEDAQARTLAVLRRLPAGLRKILVLREVEGLAMGEAARRLGLSRRAAERRWMRAVVLMSERLGEVEAVASGSLREPAPSVSALRADPPSPPSAGQDGAGRTFRGVAESSTSEAGGGGSRAR
jgi:hypothetical protein